MSSRKRVVIVESSEIISEGLKSILAETKIFNVVECEVDMPYCIERLSVTIPDLIIIDPCLLSALTRSLRTSVPDRSIILAAIVHTLHSDEQLSDFNTVISVYDSSQQVVHKLQATISQIEEEGHTNSSCELSSREREILISVAQGLSNKEIADLHNISIHTVISHRKNISHKTGIKSIAGLTVYAIMNNLISPSDTL